MLDLAKLNKTAFNLFQHICLLIIYRLNPGSLTVTLYQSTPKLHCHS